uniref:M-poneratoxin-Dq4e n=1 Tax=Dinoponera quadriceps TaxID=609295 RepID=TXM4E_DINQU|nr:RecName: Full=M-poneratoxin-Dq4e; Short=M-PONTX-Dq4e; AltName: Full=Peptide sDq-3348; AltName: Full=U-poneritoxin(01)-Dq7a; Short=PONTX(01)-Dq7 (contig 1); Short=U-PONTX(01)-Dq7a; AltName: Full=contig 9; Flags: Precursor [Dinoponera quadriceps]
MKLSAFTLAFALILMMAIMYNMAEAAALADADADAEAIAGLKDWWNKHKDKIVKVVKEMGKAGINAAGK